MTSSIKIEKVTLPKLFIFDSLKFYAKFISTAVNIADIKFISQQCLHQRIAILNVTLKIPASRSQFVLGVQISIINMSVSNVEIPVDLSDLEDEKKVEFVFLTEFGKVKLDIIVAQQVYLPFQQDCDSEEQDQYTGFNVGNRHIPLSLDVQKEQKIMNGTFKQRNFNSSVHSLMKGHIDIQDSANMKGSIIKQKIEKKVEQFLQKTPSTQKQQKIQTSTPKQRVRPKFQKITSSSKKQK